MRIKELKKRAEYASIVVLKKTKNNALFQINVYCYVSLTLKLAFNNLYFIIASPITHKPFIFKSTGMLFFKNSHKITPLATRVMALMLLELLDKLGAVILHIKLLSYGLRMKLFLTELADWAALRPETVRVLWVESITSLPLNGCKAAKRTL